MKPKWKRGWPTKPGRYLLQLECGDVASTTITFSTMENEYDQERRCLCASDDLGGESVCFNPSDTTPLDRYWGKVEASYGPIPKYRKRGHDAVKQADS